VSRLTFLLRRISQRYLLTVPASSGKRLCNGTVSVCLSVPSMDSNSDVLLLCCSQSAAASGQRQCCDPRMIDADLLCHRCRGSLSDTAIRLSVCLSHGAAALGAQLPLAIHALAAHSLAMCGLRTRPRTDVDPPRVELASAGAYRLAASGK